MTNEEQKAYDLAVENHERAMARVAELERELAALKAQPGGVVLPEPLKAAIMRADDVLHALAGWDSSSVKLEQRHGADWLKEIDAIRRELHTQLARLNQQPASGGVDERVPEGWRWVNQCAETCERAKLCATCAGCLELPELPEAGSIVEARIPHHTSDGRQMFWTEVEVIAHKIIQGAVYSWVKEPGQNGGYYAPMMLSFRPAAPSPSKQGGV